ncbi:radical SAM family heme chaperone HemW [Blastococcus sp. Marseille-P5729]|uniref:radical SAM family heme chaperone HemW n=1 Tax=Blastococcus sp. Marseille-P5729 TaxID=2086582 RepID=UPI000D0EDA8F|nr:radical SAM family heme chaperone HemW [Blastococcus sp. Marseille-P5729]
MPSVDLDSTDVVPLDGRLASDAIERAATAPFAFYVHIPFCATRCGYCDFNTYTARELTARDGSAIVSRESYAALVRHEVRLARRVLENVDLPAQSVFFGGGTPSLLPAADLVSVVDTIRDEFGLTPDAEITTEANPESVSPRFLEQLRDGGFTRVSLGMQSAAKHVLQVLDRQHSPGRAVAAAREARAAGFEHINLDLIYGAPGESDDDWRATLDVVLDAPVDHVSAYALIVEEGTALARRIARGEIAEPDDDVHADRYEMADAVLSAAGFGWYEVSNWARGPQARCRHNEIYWSGAGWWGAGPGAHSHVGGVRWWNVKHPAAYASRVGGGLSPAQGRETLTAEQSAMERVMLGIRMRKGIELGELSPRARAETPAMVTYGLLDAAALDAGRVVLTLRGRLLADAVIRDLVD